MANSALAYAGYQVFLQKKSGKRLRNRIWNVMPTLYLLAGLTGNKSAETGLGAPDTSTSVIVSGTSTPSTTKEKMFAEVGYRPTIQYASNSSADGKTMGQYSSVPVRSNGATNNPASYFIQPEFRFHERADAYEVPNDQIETIVANSTGGWPAQATTAVGNIMDAEVKTVEANHLKYWNQLLWGTTGNGYPSDQTASKWDSLHSLAYSIGPDTQVTSNPYRQGNYGGLDRSLTANAFWRGKGTDAYGNVVFRDLIRDLNYSSTYGFAAVGAGCDIIACAGNLFQKALNEADGKTGVVMHSGLPKMAEMGFKKDIVCFDNQTYVVYDPEAPSGHMACLNSATWTFAVHPQKNFKVSTPKDQTEIKGGDDVTCGTLRTKMLWCCEEPAVNAYFTGAT